jgi:hypothetical protein
VRRLGSRDDQHGRKLLSHNDIRDAG